MVYRLTALLALWLFLACGCSGPASPDGDDAPSDSETSESGYSRAVDKARNVEDQLQEAADRKQREAEEQGEG